MWAARTPARKSPGTDEHSAGRIADQDLSLRYNPVERQRCRIPVPVARRRVEEVIRFIDEHQDCRSGQLRGGIESIAKVLGIAPATYHAAKKRPPSARAVRDA